ncbi:MAG: hypothetical protein NTW21_16965 [Verrucomicrobia bacterium]|nr:hypothetical protein [Verrucomicrobiota bacterium]
MNLAPYRASRNRVKLRGIVDHNSAKPLLPPFSRGSISWRFAG